MLANVRLKYKSSEEINFNNVLSALEEYCQECEKQSTDEIDKIFLNFSCISQIKELIIKKKEILLSSSSNTQSKIEAAESVISGESQGNNSFTGIPFKEKMFALKAF